MKKGGGSNEYCPCCGLPYNFDYEYNLSESGNTAREEKLLKKSIEFEKVSRWLSSSIGLDRINDVVFNLGREVNNGNLYIDKYDQPSEKAHILYSVNKGNFITGVRAIAMTDNERKSYFAGWALHRDCAKLLEEAIQRPLEPKDEQAITQYMCDSDHKSLCLSKYNFPEFDWMNMIIKEEASFLASPLVNEAQRSRVLKCAAQFIESITHSAAKKIGSFLLEKTYRPEVIDNTGEVLDPGGRLFLKAKRNWEQAMKSKKRQRKKAHRKTRKH